MVYEARYGGGTLGVASNGGGVRLGFAEEPTPEGVLNEPRLLYTAKPVETPFIILVAGLTVATGGSGLG